MSLLRSIASGLRSLFRKERVEGDLDEELRGFLDMAAQEKNEGGYEQQGCAACRAPGAREPRSHEGSCPLCRLGISYGDLLAGFTLWTTGADEESRLHDGGRLDVGTRHWGQCCHF